MYKLTLSAGERKAIDWIGNRYSHGDELFQLLMECEWSPNDEDWDSERTLAFRVPEHVAWSIGEIGEESDYRWDCFADELSAKLTEFCLAIV